MGAWPSCRIPPRRTLLWPGVTATAAVRRRSCSWNRSYRRCWLRAQRYNCDVGGTFDTTWGDAAQHSDYRQRESRFAARRAVAPHSRSTRRMIQLMTSSTSIFGHLTQFRTWLRSSGLSPKPHVEEPPLRSELFSADQMERYGKTLASAH